MKTFVFNGWAAGPEMWGLCGFRRDRTFDYVEQLDGLPEETMDATDAAVLVGFSMGGSSALRLTLRSPEKIRGLVLVSTTPRMMEDPAAGREWRGMSERRLRALRLGTQMTFRNNPSALYEDANLDRGLDYLRTTDLRGELLAARTRLASFPVAVFQSERDGIVRPNNAGFLKEIFMQAKVTVVPGNEHALPILIPNLIDEAVKEMTR